MQKIKLQNKYFLFKYDIDKKKIKTIAYSKKISELKELIIGKKINPKNEIILLKISREKKFNPNPTKKSFLTNLVGPIKINIKIFEISNSPIRDGNASEGGYKLVLKPKFEKTVNKKGEFDPDKRNSQFLFISLDYYNKNGVKKDDMKKVGLLAIQNKLEKRLMAPKFIDQIKNVKI